MRIAWARRGPRPNHPADMRASSKVLRKTCGDLSTVLEHK
jgi:hypothetical protein